MLYESNSMQSESEVHKRQALALKSRLQPEADKSISIEEAFERLCPYMLW